MAAFTAFSPSMTGGVVGATAAVVLLGGTLVAGAATLTGFGDVNAILVTNASSLVAFARVTAVAGLTATSSDVPVLPVSARLLAAPAGAKSIFVYGIPAATLAATSALYFTPGEGGTE
jgi:hypothetical protein